MLWTSEKPLSPLVCARGLYTPPLWILGWLWLFQNTNIRIYLYVIRSQIISLSRQTYWTGTVFDRMRSLFIFLRRKELDMYSKAMMLMVDNLVVLIHHLHNTMWHMVAINRTLIVPLLHLNTVVMSYLPKSNHDQKRPSSVIQINKRCLFILLTQMFTISFLGYTMLMYLNIPWKQNIKNIFMQSWFLDESINPNETYVLCICYWIVTILHSDKIYWHLTAWGSFVNYPETNMHN